MMFLTSWSDVATTMRTNSGTRSPLLDELDRVDSRVELRLRAVGLHADDGDEPAIDRGVGPGEIGFAAVDLPGGEPPDLGRVRPLTALHVGRVEQRHLDDLVHGVAAGTARLYGLIDRPDLHTGLRLHVGTESRAAVRVCAVRDVRGRPHVVAVGRRRTVDEVIFPLLSAAAATVEA